MSGEMCPNCNHPRRQHGINGCNDSYRSTDGETWVRCNCKVTSMDLSPNKPK